eukprot:SAG11_NODE_2646_length_3132_cov_4.768216_5_plen_39_part_00
MQHCNTECATLRHVGVGSRRVRSGAVQTIVPQYHSTIV